MVSTNEDFPNSRPHPIDVNFNPNFGNQIYSIVFLSIKVSREKSNRLLPWLMPAIGVVP